MATLFWVQTAGGTWNGTAGTKWSTTSGGPSGAGPPTSSDDVVFDANSGSAAVTISVSPCKSLNCTGFTGTLTGGAAFTVSDGNVTWGAGMTLAATGIMTLASTSGVTRTLTSNGIMTTVPIIVNGAGGVYQLGDAFTSNKSFTLSAGTFAQNGKAFSVLSFTTTSGTRAFTSDASFTCSGTGAVLTATGAGLTWTCTTASVLKVTDASASAKTVSVVSTVSLNDVQFSGSGSGSLTLSASGGALTCRDIAVSNTGAAAFTTGQLACRAIDFTGFTGSWTDSGGGTATTCTGNVTLVGTMTMSTTGTTTLAASSGTQTLTSNGKAWPSPLTCNGGTTTVYSLADALSVSSTLTLNAGTLQTNGKALTATAFVETTSSSALIDMTNSTVTCPAWSVSSPATVTATGSTLIVNPASSAQHFNGGAQTYGLVQVGGAGVTFQDSNTFAGGLQVTAAPCVLNFSFSATLTLGGVGLVATGSAGNLITLAGTGTTGLSIPANDVTCDYLNVSGMNFAGGARWFLGRHSTDAGSNHGGRFTAPYRTRASLAA